jgi:GWxTD domain-containing protein
VVESFDIGGWQPGSYLLEITAIDKSAGQEVIHDIPLIVVAPVYVGGQLASVVGEDPADQLDLEVQLALVGYLLTPEEKTTLDGLTDAGKMNFLDQFWQENDSDPSTAIIENRAEIYQRYLYANNFFSMTETRTDGWLTDRGRVLMVYGHCDNLDDMQHPTGGFPYQVWNYYTHGEGAVFVFQDQGNLGDFRLVHSSVEGELFSKGWDEVLRSGDLSGE